MAVLCDIKKMSQNPKYGNWCVKSKDKIATWLDLSRATVFNAIKTLEDKGYIERSEMGLRPTAFIFQLDMASDEIGIYIKNDDLELISKKVSELLDAPSKNYTTPVQNLDSTPSKNYTQDIILKENIDIIPLNTSLNNKTNRTKNKKFEPPTIEQVQEFFKQEGYRDDVAIKAFKYYSEANWHDSYGKPVKNWKQKMRAVWFKDENILIIKKDKPKDDIAANF